MGLIKNTVGNKYGRLTVLERLPFRRTSSGRTVSMIKCVCDCGNIKVAKRESVVGGNTRSCGCLRREHARKNNIKMRKRPYEYLYNKLVRQADERDLPVNISYEYFIEFTKIDKCHYCGGIITLRKYCKRNRSIAHHIDRKDNSKGYSKENMAVCCGECNWHKSSYFNGNEYVLVMNALKIKNEIREYAESMWW